MKKITFLLLLSIAMASNARAQNNYPTSGDARIAGLTIGVGLGNVVSNTAIGHLALSVNTTGSNDAAIGFQALQNNKTGNQNTALGSGALNANTSNANTGIGYHALTATTSGKMNTGIGTLSLQHNTTGSANTAVGNDAAAGNTKGYGNVALGDHTLFSNMLNSHSIAIGDSAMYNFNNGLGEFSDVAIGYLSLFSVTGSGGYDNVAVGNETLYHNTNGLYNVAVGTQAMFSNAGGFNDAAVGDYTMEGNTEGYENSAFGSSSMVENKTGNENSAFGSYAMYFTDRDSGVTSIGEESDEFAADGLHNSTALGAEANNTASNQVRVGNAAVTSIGGFAGWSNFSDGRYKKNIKTDVPGLEFINQLTPLTYTLDVNGIEAKLRGGQKTMVDKNGKALHDIMNEPFMKRSMQAKSKIIYTGFIAQDVEKAAQSVGFDFSGVDKPKDDQTGFYGLRYGDFVVPLVKAVQELSARNDSLQAEIDELKAPSNTNGMVKVSIANSSNTTLLGQNIPNPFDHSTLIPFRIPNDCHDASIAIMETATGRIIHLIPVSCTETELSFDAGSLASGNYSYSLYVDGKLVETKQMVLTK